MEKKFVVYAHIFPNGKIYIGITSQLVQRRWRNGKAYSSNVRMTRAINKYGWDNIEHQILFDGLAQSTAEQIEKELIYRLSLQDESRGYNIAGGGTHPQHSEETRRKIGEKSFGRTHTEKFKKWISEKNSGPGNYMFGRHHSAETKKKISEAKKGRSPKPNAGLFGSQHPSAKRILALDRTTGEPVKTFGSIVDASKELNISKSCIQAALHGQQKSAAGYGWVYA